MCCKLIYKGFIYFRVREHGMCHEWGGDLMFWQTEGKRKSLICFFYIFVEFKGGTIQKCWRGETSGMVFIYKVESLQYFVEYLKTVDNQPITKTRRMGYNSLIIKTLRHWVSVFKLFLTDYWFLKIGELIRLMSSGKNKWENYLDIHQIFSIFVV